MPIFISFIICGGAFILLDKAYYGLLSSSIDAVIYKVAGKSVLLYVLITFGAMIGSLGLANALIASNPLAGWVFGAIGFILFGYIASARYR